MKRRSFIKKVGAVGATAIAAPYILPSGRLFAQSGNPKAEHVVFVMFGGGVRQQEAVLQRYLSDSQGLDIPGNIMPNLFSGSAPESKIVYGTDGDLPGERPIPPVLDTPLDQQGILFPEVACNSAGHFNGFVSLLQGNTLITQGLRQRPLLPTVFEYLRRHAGMPASKVWYIGHSVLNSTPLLNHSLHPDYGTKYGANMFIPPTTFGMPGEETFALAKTYSEEEMRHIYDMKYFLDNYYQNIGRQLDELGNTEEEKRTIKDFMKRMYVEGKGKSVVSGAIEVMREFKPNFIAFSLFGVDVCHGNFTSYLQAAHAADNVIGRIWNEIQSIDEMKDNTILIVTPEHGRNLNPNPIKDQNDWFGYDHSDANSLRIFTSMAGPGVPQGVVIGNEDNPIGHQTDNVPTIGDIFGIKEDIYNAGHLRAGAQSLFDRI